MPDRASDHESEADQGGLPAILAAILVFVLIVVLFLLFKFNLFNGGHSVNVRTTAPTWLG